MLGRTSFINRRFSPDVTRDERGCGAVAAVGEWTAVGGLISECRDARHKAQSMRGAWSVAEDAPKSSSQQTATPSAHTHFTTNSRSSFSRTTQQYLPLNARHAKIPHRSSLHSSSFWWPGLLSCTLLRLWSRPPPAPALARACRACFPTQQDDRPWLPGSNFSVFRGTDDEWIRVPP